MVPPGSSQTVGQFSGAVPITPPAIVPIFKFETRDLSPPVKMLSLVGSDDNYRAPKSYVLQMSFILLACLFLSL